MKSVLFQEGKKKNNNYKSTQTFRQTNQSCHQFTVHENLNFVLFTFFRVVVELFYFLTVLEQNHVFLLM